MLSPHTSTPPLIWNLVDDCEDNQAALIPLVEMGGVGVVDLEPHLCDEPRVSRKTVNVMDGKASWAVTVSIGRSAPRSTINEIGFVLYHGDCLKVLNEFADDYFDMIFADPPYLLSNGGFTVHAGQRASVNKGVWDKSNGLEKDFDFHLNWIQACRRVLKPHGTLWISGTHHSI